MSYRYARTLRVHSEAVRARPDRFRRIATGRYLARRGHSRALSIFSERGARPSFVRVSRLDRSLGKANICTARARLEILFSRDRATIRTRRRRTERLRDLARYTKTRRRRILNPLAIDDDDDEFR